MSETELVKACLTVLAAKRIFAWRNNSGALRVGKRFVRFGEPGSPDIIGILPKGRFLGVECKIKANPLSTLQEDFRAMVIAAGGCYIIVRDSVDELILQLQVETA